MTGCDGWISSPTQWIWVWVNSGSLVMDREAWHATVHGVTKSRTRLSDWTELNLIARLPWCLSSKESACSAGDTRDVSSIPGSGRYPAEGNGNSFQYFCLGYPMDRGSWWVTVHGATRIRLDLATKPPTQFYINYNIIPISYDWVDLFTYLANDRSFQNFETFTQYGWNVDCLTV